MCSTNEVVLANSDESYAFIERMITAVTSCLRSKRIHIGMDEVCSFDFFFKLYEIISYSENRHMELVMGATNNSLAQRMGQRSF